MKNEKRRPFDLNPESWTKNFRGFLFEKDTITKKVETIRRLSPLFLNTMN